MDELESSILHTWQRLKPRILANPKELSRRLARHQCKSFSRSPRAWCLAVRANDTRIPTHACDPEPFSHKRHNVVLHRPLLFQLCSPVRIEPPGETIREVAAKLGVNRIGLLWARINGVFRTHYLPTARRLPLLYTDRPLDPSTRMFVCPDPIWSWTATYIVNRIPPDFAQKLVRIPCYYDRNSRYNDLDNDDNPPRACAPSNSRHLPARAPDYVWYKWKGDEYLGYDWRSPGATAAHFKNEQRKHNQRQAAKRRRRENPPPSKSTGSVPFRGWRWLCPQCTRAVRILYCPQPPIPFIKLTPQLLSLSSTLHPLPSPPYSLSFACRDCLRIENPTRIPRGSWNRIVAHLSNFLLYGHEVPRPTWFTPPPNAKRLGPRTPQIARHREQILQALLDNWSYARIAQHLGVPRSYITYHAHALYQHHNIKGGRRALAQHFGKSLPPNPNSLHPVKSPTARPV